ncbi:hypothetical protein PSTT_08060 [Puccinia striiformis]|uniref:Uncharacterized protein n=1 Tax=Puccinia striiformis TaxID=27350 RepID=A0A2S4VE13_9BASI|nr:hypothetical protein PSTT_08060 [Puccinia striiformis]
MITSQEPITKETSTQAHHGNPEKEINMKDFQARLETSIGNIQAMAQEFKLRLGLGSIAPKQPPSQLTTSKLHSHLTKKAKKDGEHHIAEAKNSDNHPEQIDEEEDEEDSRTSTFGKKRTAPINESSSFSLLQPTPKDQNSVHPLNGDDDGHSLSKRKIKKLRKLAKARELAATRNKRS